MKLKAFLVISILTVAGVATANLLKNLTFGGNTTVNIDGGNGSTVGLASDSFVMPLANRGVQCNLLTVPSTNGATPASSTVALAEQVSNDNVNFVTTGIDSGTVTSLDSGVVPVQLAITPQPFAFARVLIEGQQGAGQVVCTSNNTDQP